MSDFEGVAFVDGRLPYNLGHAAFEFIESRWGKEGIRQFLFALRKNVIGGGESAYEEAFKLKAEEFDEQFDKYLKDRFKPFRDKERPADYGRDLAPKRGKTPFVSVVSIEPSPSGDLMAVAAGNRKEQELDIILLSTKDSKVIRNLTSGFNKDHGYEYIATPGGFRNNAVPWMSWSPANDRIGYFARTEKMKTLILQNVGHGEDRPAHRAQDRRHAGVARHQPGRQGSRVLRRSSAPPATSSSSISRPRSPQRDQRRRSATTRRPGRPTASRSSISRAPAATTSCSARRRHGHQDAADVRHARRRRRAVRRRRHAGVPVDGDRPESAARSRGRAQRQHLQHLDAQPENEGAAAVHRHADRQHVARRPARHQAGAHRLCHLLQGRVRHSRARARGTAAHRRVERLRRRPAGPPIPLPAADDAHARAGNMRKKGAFEKLFLEGRPPVALGVTSGGDLFGGTQVTFTDVLGDKQFNIFAASVSQYRTLSFSYINLSRRLQYAIQGYSQTQFFYGYDPSVLYGIDYGYIDRDQAIATQTARGATITGIYPLNRYTRLEMSAGFLQFNQEYNEPGLAGRRRRLPAGPVRPRARSSTASSCRSV